MFRFVFVYFFTGLLLVCNSFCSIIGVKYGPLVSRKHTGRYSRFFGIKVSAVEPR